MLAKIPVEFNSSRVNSTQNLILKVALCATVIYLVFLTLSYIVAGVSYEFFASIIGVFLSAFSASFAQSNKTRIASFMLIFSSIFVVLTCLIVDRSNPFTFAYFLPISVAVIYFDFNINQKKLINSLIVGLGFLFLFFYSSQYFAYIERPPSRLVMLVDLITVLILIATLMTFGRLKYASIKRDIKRKMCIHNDQADAVERSKLFLRHRRMELENIREESQLKLYEQRQQLSRVKAHQEQLKQFAYAASHDLKEPIRTIRSFLQIVKRKVPANELTSELQDYFSFVDVNASAMHDVLERLLLFSRIQQLTELPQPVALHKFLSQSILKAGQTDLLQSLQTILPGNLREIEILSVPVYGPIMLAEILHNASKFYPTQEVDRPVSIHVEHLNGKVEIDVLDRGIGIDSIYRDQVFGLFQRLNSKEAYPGAGLGLSIAKAISIRSGATIQIYPRAGGGTRVSLTLEVAH